MHISSLKIEHFRGVRSLEVDGLARVNLLLGKNNVGKTTVLEAVFLVSGVGNPRRSEVVDKLRGLYHESGDDFRFLFYGLDTQEPFKLAASYSLNDRYAVPAGQSQISVLGEPVLSDVDDPLYGGGELGEPIEGVRLHVSLQEPGFVGEADAFIRRTRGSKSARVNVSPRLKEFNRSVFVQTAPDIRELSKRLEWLTVNKRTGRLIEVLQGLDHRIQDISLGSEGRIYLDIGLPTLLPLNLMGDGVRRLVNIVTTVSNSQGGIVLIDEIDNGLHYTALSLLWRAILVAAEAFSVQVIATTHSREALEHLTGLLEEPEMRTHGDAVRAFDLVRGDDNRVRAYRYDAEQLDFALDHDLDVRS